MFEKIGKLETDPNKKMNQEVPKNQHEIWKKSWGESYVIKDCLSHDDLEWLTDLMYRRHHKRRVRENGVPLQFLIRSSIVGIFALKIWMKKSFLETAR